MVMLPVYKPKRATMQGNLYKTYYYVNFTEEEIEKAKIYTKKRDEYNITGYNNFNNGVNHNWIGILGEWAFAYMLKQLELPFTWHKQKAKDQQDFTIPKRNIYGRDLEIDVKCQFYRNARDVEPYHNCYVVEKQIEKTKKADYPVNMFVFSKWIDIDKQVVLVGYIWVDDFLKNGKFRRATEYTNLSTNDYAITISKLSRITDIDKSR